MTGATVCSGILAPEVAAPHIDWRWCAEIEEFPCSVIAYRRPALANLGDITAKDFTKRAAMFGQLDVLVGGTPCQDLSVAGKRGGLAAERSGLFFRFVEIIEALKPHTVLFENVPGLLSSNNGEDFIAVLDAFQNAGYLIDADIHDAQHFGLAQRRRRVFVVCHRVDSLLQKRTLTSEIITLQLLAEMSLGILGVASVVSRGEPDSWASSKDRAVDSLRKRMKLFGLHLESGLRRLLIALGDTLAMSQQELESSDLGLGRKGTDTKPIKVVQSDPTPSAMGNHTAYLNIGDSWNPILDELCSLAKLFTTSIATREITQSQISICSEVALRTARRIVQLSPSSHSFLAAASSILIVLQECIAYARQATSTLFGDVEWHEYWIDFDRQASESEDALRSVRGRAYREQVLPFLDSMRRDYPPSREAREGITQPVAPSLTNSGRGVERGGDSRGQDPVVAMCLNARGGSGRIDGESETFIAHSLRADGFDASEDGTGRGTPIVPDIAPCLTQNYGKQPDNSDTNAGPMLVADTLRSHPRPGSATSGAIIPILEAGARTGNSTDDPRAGIGIGADGDPMFTLQSGKQQAVAVHGTQDPCMSDVAFALQRNAGRENAIFVEVDDRLELGLHTCECGREFVGTMSTRCPSCGEFRPGYVTYPPIANRCKIDCRSQIPPLAFSSKDHGADAGDLAPTLRSMGHDKSHANGGGQVAVAVNFRGREGGTAAEMGGEVATALRCAGGSSSTSHALVNMAVRRLTPAECARLQGFPDNWTRIPVKFYKTRRITKLRSEDMWEKAEGGWWLMAADGPQYKAYGNSMAVPCIGWILDRITASIAGE